MQRPSHPTLLDRCLRQLAAPALIACAAATGCCTPAPDFPSDVTTAETGAAAGRAQAGRIVNMGQPTAEELAAFAAEGYGLVLDMRTAGEDRGFDEAATAAELGMEYQNLGFREPDTLTDDLLAQFIESVGSTDGPVLLHCKSGNRSAGTWLAWRVLGEGVDFETALPEAKAMGLRNEAYAQRVREFIASR